MTKVKFGFCLPVFGGSSAWDRNIDFQALKTMIPTCEKLGFDSLWVHGARQLGLAIKRSVISVRNQTG